MSIHCLGMYGSMLSICASGDDILSKTGKKC